MLNDFSKFKFEVIDIVSITAPKVTINMYDIVFNRKVLEMLGNPEYVKPLLDNGNKAFAIQVCKANDVRAMKFKSNTDSGSFRHTGTIVRASLRYAMREKWKDDRRYEMVGVLFPEEKAVVFDLTAAEELPAFVKNNVNK